MSAWLAVNQFSIKGPNHTRRPDIILFVNGLPLVLLEIRNPADERANVWKAYDQIQTHKAQIPDPSQTNEMLVISDGTEALLGSLSSDAERFMAWRTIDGSVLDPLGAFNEWQTLVRGVLAPALLLDYLRCLVLFEDDRGIFKKVAGHQNLDFSLQAYYSYTQRVLNLETAVGWARVCRERRAWQGETKRRTSSAQ